MRVGGGQHARFQQLVEIAHARDAVVAKEGADHRILSRQCAGVIEHGALRCGGATHLEGQDPLSPCRRGAHRGRECLRPPQGLDEDREGANALVPGDELEVVRDVAYRFVADGDDIADPDVARILGERHRDGPALGNNGQRSGPDPGKVGHPERGLRPDVDQPHVVRSAHGHLVLRGDIAQPALPHLALRTAVRIAARVDAECAHPAASGLQRELRSGGGRDREEGGIDRLGKRGQRRVAAQPEHLLVAGIHRVHTALVAEVAQVAEHDLPGGVRAGRGAHHRDRGGREERRQVEDTRFDHAGFEDTGVGGAGKREPMVGTMPRPVNRAAHSVASLCGTGADGSKRGDQHLRCLMIHGARSALRAAGRRPDRRSRWAVEVEKRRGTNIAAVALANKNARTAWAMLAREVVFDAAYPAKKA